MAVIRRQVSVIVAVATDGPAQAAKAATASRKRSGSTLFDPRISLMLFWTLIGSDCVRQSLLSCLDLYVNSKTHRAFSAQRRSHQPSRAPPLVGALAF
jgi:hypothetical protein